MILRALFWITLVSLLMPREPDLGFGRPGAQQGIVQSTLSWATASLAQPNSVCKGHEGACATTLGVLDSLQSMAVRNLSQVKADIEQQERERAAHTRLSAD
jgi:hypothetical protein